MDTDSPPISGRRKREASAGSSSQGRAGGAITDDAGQAGKLPKAVINAGVYKHKCGFCDSTFQKTEHLRRHERSHTKERPFGCSECGKKFTRADSLVRHSRLHEIDGETPVDAMGQTAGGSGSAYRDSTGLSRDPREGHGLGRKGSIHLHDDMSTWSGSMSTVMLPQDAGSPYEPAAKRRRPNEGSSLLQGRPDLEQYGSEAAYMGTRISDAGWNALAMPGPSQVLEINSTSMLQAAAGLDALSHPSDQGAFNTPSSVMVFGKDPEPHFDGLLLDHIRNPQNNYATSYRTPQSEGDSNRTPISTVEHSAYMFEQHARLGDSREHTEGPTLSQRVETPGGGFQPYADVANLESLGAGPSLDQPGNGFELGRDLDFETGAYSIPIGFGVEENSDLDLLQFLASDTSIAFAHTLIPEYTTYTRPNSPGPSNSMLPRSSPMHFPADPLLDPAIIAKPNAGGNDLLQPDHQYVPLSPKMAALWKNLMTDGVTETQGQLRVPVDSARANSRSATPAAVGLNTRDIRHRSSAREEEGQGASVASDSHLASERDRTQDAITEAKHLISDLSFHLSASTSPLSSAFLDKGLKLFFSRFLPTFQVIHQPTWSLKSASASLVINMIALGTLYMTEDGDKAKGESLWRLVYKGCCISWERLIELRAGPSDPTRGTTLCQTILLGQIYAALAQRNSMRASPYTFQGFGLRIARISGIFRIPKAAADDFLPNDGDCSQIELDNAWRSWASYESQLRAVLGLYVVEGQFVQLYRVPPTSSHLSNPFVSACDDQLFNAPSARAWKALLLERQTDRERRRENTFSAVYRHLFNEQYPNARFELGLQLPSISKNVLLTGLHTAIAHLRESKAQGLLDDHRSAINLHLGFKRLYGVLRSSSPSASAEASTIRMGWHSAYIELLLVEALSPENLLMSANIPLGMPDICPVADEKMRYTRTALGRRILVHANAIRLAAMDLPFSAIRYPSPFVPAYIYRAGLALLAYVLGKANEAFNTNAEAFELSTQTDFDSMDITSHPAMSPMVHNPYEYTSDTAAKRFITEGGPVILNHNPLQLDDLAGFVSWLRPFGEVFGVANAMADDLEYRIQGAA